ncbi:Crp/Fnr family transcriptional regulator [Variovorax sp. W6]|uniref:Crp/Fnr family transcriptional regulator n=1 Tax=Variovorax sp. W6 TaxID=3093895 RepID=UPI003D804487
MRQSIASDDAPLMERALRATSGFESWPAAAMNRLLLSSHLKRHARGELLTSEADAPITFAVVSGHVIVGRNAQRETSAKVFLLGPGSVMGLAQMIEKENPIWHDHYAHDEVLAIHMPTVLIFEILDSHPLLWKSMVAMVLDQHAEIRDSLLVYAIGAFPQRLAATIDRLATAYGTDVEGSLRLRVRQEDIAVILQVTRQSVNKELKAMVAAGVINAEYNTITILNREALREIAFNR